jgi:hypothetical protein
VSPTTTEHDPFAHLVINISIFRHHTDCTREGVCMAELTTCDRDPFDVVDIYVFVHYLETTIQVQIFPGTPN